MNKIDILKAVGMGFGSLALATVGAIVEKKAAGSIANVVLPFIKRKGA